MWRKLLKRMDAMDSEVFRIEREYNDPRKRPAMIERRRQDLYTRSIALSYQIEDAIADSLKDMKPCIICGEKTTTVFRNDSGEDVPCCDYPKECKGKAHEQGIFINEGGCSDYDDCPEMFEEEEG